MLGAAFCVRTVTIRRTFGYGAMFLQLKLKNISFIALSLRRRERAYEVSFGSDRSQQSCIQNVRISIHSVRTILDSPLTPMMVQGKLKNDQWNWRKSLNLCFLIRTFVYIPIDELEAATFSPV
ncbi:Uncharacterized protein Rs2_05313 [Raphanus sativus]|nr:Uncharacterized protein Rs2_05313 [Raphanus sativus]